MSIRPALPPDKLVSLTFFKITSDLKDLCMFLFFQFTCHLPVGGHFQGVAKTFFLLFLCQWVYETSLPHNELVSLTFFKITSDLKDLCMCILFSIHLSFACGRSFSRGCKNLFSYYFSVSEYMRPAYPPMSWSHSPFLRSLLTLKIFACVSFFQFTCHLPVGGHFQGVAKTFFLTISLSVSIWDQLTPQWAGLTHLF